MTNYQTKNGLPTEDLWAAYRGKEYGEISTGQLVCRYVIAGVLALAVIGTAVGLTTRSENNSKPSKLETTVQSLTTQK